MDSDNKKSTEGYLYCIYNEVYDQYGEDVYKLGEANDIKQRLIGYCTYYITPCQVKYCSELIRNKSLAEAILFSKLAEFRITMSREFFKCDIAMIKKEIDHVVKLFDIYSDDELREHFLQTKNQLFTIDNLINATNITLETYKQLVIIDNKTIDDRLAIEKYLYATTFKTIPEYVNIDFMNKYYNRRHVPNNYNNLINLFNDIDVEDDKIKCIKKLINGLGFGALDAIIDKEIFQDNYIKINEFVDDKFKKLFNLKTNKINELCKINKTNKKIIGFLNTLFKDYGVEINVIQKRKYDKIKKFQIAYVHGYRMNTLNDLII